MEQPLVHYKGIDIHYHDQGKGPVLVLLHGFLENAHMWRPLIDSLSDRYRCIAIDLLGHGKTPCLGYVHSMEDQADMVFAVLHALKIRKVAIAGHSMGGYVALAFGELFPDIVKGILLVNSTARADSDERKTNRDRAIVAVKQNHSQFIRMSIANLFSEANRTRLEAEIEAVKQEALQTPLQGVVAALEGMKIRKDREVLLHFAPYPIHCIAGAQDPVLPLDQLQEQMEGTSGALYILPDGHMATVENRDPLPAIFKGFLKQTLGR